ncbi:MAG: hypothetical protein KAW09_00310, partial [Thermoplasmata archaeon]|nr:hypothetical protein [Thermoplasmata archaeon]
WLSPIDDGGSPVMHYSVYRGFSSGDVTYLTTPGNVLMYEDSGLTNGMTYHYQVTASNAMGEGAKSSEASATPSVPPPNQAPMCTISSPAPGETMSERFAVMGTASDTDGEIEFVEIRVGNSGWMRAIGTTSWSYDLDTTVFSDGKHTIYARSFDGTDYSALGALTVTVSNAEEPPPDVGAYDWAITLALVVVLIALLVVLGVVFYLRLGRKKTEPVRDDIEKGGESA